MFIIEQKDKSAIRNCRSPQKNALTAVSINRPSFPFSSIAFVAYKIDKSLLPRDRKINIANSIYVTFEKPIFCVCRSLWEVPNIKTNQKFYSFTFKNVRKILFL
jgi:hypothetical protein